MGNLFSFDITKETKELKKIIDENPDLPIAVLVSEDASYGAFCWTYCERVWFQVQEILCCETPMSEYVFTDRSEFEEELEDWLYWEMKDEMSVAPADADTVQDREPSEEEFQTRLKQEIEKYEPYWKKTICIYASN